MHTFFINTSENKIDQYDDVFEVCRENRELISLDCPIAEWHNENGGYKALASEIGEIIDSYRDVGNEYNLILYVDLFRFNALRNIPRGENLEREQCILALKAVVRRYMRVTILDELEDRGRTPSEILVVFDENEYPEERDDIDLEPSPVEDYFMKYFLSFIGLPSVKEITNIAKRHFTESVTPKALDSVKEAFLKEIIPEKKKELLAGLYEAYAVIVKDFLDMTSNEDGVAGNMKQLFNKVVDLRQEDLGHVHSVSFATNSIAAQSNQFVNARRAISLMIYILECCKYGIFVAKDGDSRDRAIRPFPELDWKLLEDALWEKLAAVNDKLSDIENEDRVYSNDDMKLAPKLYKLYTERFGLDEYGGLLEKIELTPAATDSKDGDDSEDDDVFESNVNGKTIRYSKHRIFSIFTNEQFPSFRVSRSFDDSGFDEWCKKPETLVEKAKELCRYHRHYLDELKVHVSRVLSNYSGRSHENRPALLKKRVVRENEETRYNYRRASGSRDTSDVDSRYQQEAEDFAETAYETVRQEFMKGGTARIVSATDVTKQAEWFCKRVEQITKSLKLLHLVAIGLLVGILAVYIPFAVIQWEAITESFLSLVTALGSVGVPLLILYTVYGVMCARQKKRYREVWDELMGTSKKALANNDVSVDLYDRMLAFLAPSLRWVYEYKLDVAFYDDCCKMAGSKRDHHKQKLRQRRETIENILQDLDSAEDIRRRSAVAVADEIDYNFPFCTGDKNPEFYSIIDNNMLEALTDGKRG